MVRIKRTVVASGVIGQCDHEWEVKMLCINKYAKCYDLYINKEFINSFSSVAMALVALTEQFAE